MDDDRKAQNREAKTAILKKIKTMLAMADGRAADEQTANEASVAAEMAAKLMQQHGIDFSDVQTQELESGEGLGSEWVYANINKGKARDVSNWAQWLAIATASSFECKCRIAPGEVQVTSTRKETCNGVQFVGYELDVKVCAWMYQYLFRAVVNHSVVHAVQLQSSGIKANDMKPHLRKFREKMSGILCMRLAAQTRERAEEQRAGAGNALVILESHTIDEAYGEDAFATFQQDYQPDFTSESAQAGAVAGMKVDLNVRGVHAGAEREKIARG